MPDTNLPVGGDLPTPLIPLPSARQRPKVSVVWGLVCGLGLALALGLSLLLANRRSAGAAPRVHVGPVIVAEPSVPTPLPIQIGPAELIPQQGWIRIVGLPPLASLSDGYAIAPGLWSVPTTRLLGLAITAPSGDGIRSNVNIALMSPQGSVLAEAQSMLVVIPASRLVATGGQIRSVGPPSGIELACPEVAASELPGVGAEPYNHSSEPERRRRAETLVHTGDKWLGDGNVAAAREFYKRSADMRWSPAAFALGATYDPHETLRGRLIGMSGDLRMARCWYARARELADMEAASQGKN